MAKIDYEHVWTDKKRTLFGLPLSFTRYILTEKKLITRKGLLSITEDEIELYRVIDKSLKLPLGQRMFGCGTVVINCRDTDTPVKEVVSVKNPREFMQVLEKYVDKDVILGIRPEHIHDEPKLIEEFKAGIVDAKVEITELMGAETYLYLDSEGHNMIARVAPETTAKSGDEIQVAFEPNKIHLFDKDTEQAICH